MTTMESIDHVIDCKSAPERFVSINHRENACDFPASFWDNIAKNSCYVDWKGIPLQKDAHQIVMTQQLIQDLQPKTIIEFGSFKGGSALWLADIQALSVQGGKVISTDIDLSHVSPRVRHDHRVEFIQGDSFYIESMLPIQTLKELLHPILVIEDAHFNTIGILDYFHQHLFQAGDYFIVEDTNMDYNNACYHVWRENFATEYCDSKLDNLNRKMPDLKQWLNNQNEAYLVDTKYVDPFGMINATKNWNSVIRKMK
jgi:cephalosporin hydroxylase